MSHSKIFDVLIHIREYCVHIDHAIERFGREQKIFDSDSEYRASVGMYLMQIGNLASLLPEEFRQMSEERVKWKEIRGMRNLFAHVYEKMDVNIIWDVATQDIPDLKKYCDDQIKFYETLSHPPNEIQDVDELER